MTIIHHLFQPTVEVVTDEDGSNPTLGELTWTEAWTESQSQTGDEYTELDPLDDRIQPVCAWLDQHVATEGLALRPRPSDPYVTFGDDCNPEFIMRHLPLGLAVTLSCHHQVDTDIEWNGCTSEAIHYREWPGHEGMPGPVIKHVPWTDVTQIRIH